MTTTTSKHDLNLQQQQQQQRSTISFKNFGNTNLLINNTFSGIINNTVAEATTTTTTTNDNIQIDSLNNNNTSLITILSIIPNPTETTTTTTLRAATTIINDTIPSPSSYSVNNNNISHVLTSMSAGNSPETEQAPQQQKIQKRRSLLNFKSFDFNIKSLYTGLRNGSKNTTHAQSQSSFVVVGNGNGSSSHIADTPIIRSGGAPGMNNRMMPYLKIESVDIEESENLLDYPQSPYSSRRNSSHDDNRSSSQLLHINRYEMSRSQASSPSPYFLSPSSGNIRRSSTSDIMSCKRGTSGTSSGSNSRRPSTSDLLRRARERKGSEARMGRSISHGGLLRGGFRGSVSGAGAGAGGRRTSMAF